MERTGSRRFLWVLRRSLAPCACSSAGHLFGMFLTLRLQDPNNRVSGPKYFNINGIWALKSHYLGPLYPFIVPMYPYIYPLNPFKGTLLFGSLDPYRVMTRLVLQTYSPARAQKIYEIGASVELSYHIGISEGLGFRV